MECPFPEKAPVEPKGVVAYRQDEKISKVMGALPDSVQDEGTGLLDLLSRLGARHSIDGSRLRRRSHRNHRAEVSLQRVGSIRKQALKGAVEPVAEARGAATGVIELVELASSKAPSFPKVLVRPHICTAEAINRLFGVADQKQASRPASGESLQ